MSECERWLRGKINISMQNSFTLLKIYVCSTYVDAIGCCNFKFGRLPYIGSTLDMLRVDMPYEQHVIKLKQKPCQTAKSDFLGRCERRPVFPRRACNLCICFKAFYKSGFKMLRIWGLPKKFNFIISSMYVTEPHRDKESLPLSLRSEHCCVRSRTGAEETSRAIIKVTGGRRKLHTDKLHTTYHTKFIRVNT
jgi:hypothetical protein